MLRSVLILVAVNFATAAFSQARADECDALLAQLSATISGLEIGERVAAPEGNSVSVALKNAAADEIKLTCATPGSNKPNQISLSWHSAFAPPAFFDLVASAGAVLTPTVATVIRRGALSCQQRALAADIEVQDLDLAGAHFECHVSTQNGGKVEIAVESARDQLPPVDPPDATAQESAPKKTGAKRTKK